MLNYRNQAEAKKVARALEKALKTLGLELSHGQALDTLARVDGFQDYNALNDSLSPAAVDSQLSPVSLKHIEGAGDCEYGLECALVTHTGFEVRYAADPETLLDYVRVCDPLGREIAYWVSDEWRDDPEVVMGALMGALAQSRPQLVNNGKLVRKDSRLTETTNKPSKAVPRIQDIDFMKTHAVIFDGFSHNIDWREEAVLALLQADPASDEFQDWADSPALRVHTLDDGFVIDGTISLQKLASLTWNAQTKCFADPDGNPYQFFFELDTETYLTMFAGR